MQADLKWLDDPETFRINQLQAHSDHYFFRNHEEMETDKNSLAQSLNGNWKFHYSKNAMERPQKFYEEQFDTSSFDSIEVPCHIEMAGYDQLHYINTLYPWDGSVYRRPAYSLGDTTGKPGMFSQALYNPVGSYLKEFDLEEGLRGKRVIISLEGVEQAMFLWLNGEFVGYAEDSFTVTEFDLTPYIKDEKNILAIQVHKYSTAAFLEDQDFFRFFGIFRNITLFAKPKMHVEDLWAKPEFDSYSQNGTFGLRLKVSAEKATEGTVTVSLKDSQGQACLEKTMPLQENLMIENVPVGKVVPWSHQNPYLYLLEIELRDETGKIVEVVPYKIGFRTIEIVDRVIMLNQERLILNGVNRHEWSAWGGRCITIQDMKFDLEVFRKNNINAVRTCHYPDQIPWYYLCDEAGIYVMAETNLETHGSWMKLGIDEPSWNLPGSIPQWKEAVQDRARTNFECFKNHPAILFWSLGNESYAGDNIESMNAFFKEKSDGRLIHYEGVTHNRCYEKTISDVESRMYAYPEQIREYLEHDPLKPFILCEYMHDMGNSLGGMGSYIRLLDEYQMYQGGFIWDYIDQAIWTKDEATGKYVLRYGGDFDDRPSDYAFSGDGIMFADRTEKPAMQEVRYYYGLHR